MGNGTERTIAIFPHMGPGPKKIIIDYYGDHYTPLDVIGGLLSWLLDNPGYIQEWAEYVDSGTGEFNGEDAKQHLAILASMLFRIHDVCDHFDVHVIGNRGQVN